MNDAYGYQIPASQLLLRGRNASPFSTGDATFDALFSRLSEDEVPTCEKFGGLAANSVLEISGAPGEGKTRCCVSFALACRVQMSGTPQDMREVLCVGLLLKNFRGLIDGRNVSGRHRRRINAGFHL